MLFAKDALFKIFGVTTTILWCSTAVSSSHTPLRGEITQKTRTEGGRKALFDKLTKRILDVEDLSGFYQSGRYIIQSEYADEACTELTAQWGYALGVCHPTPQGLLDFGSPPYLMFLAGQSATSNKVFVFFQYFDDEGCTMESGDSGFFPGSFNENRPTLCTQWGLDTGFGGFDPNGVFWKTYSVEDRIPRYTGGTFLQTYATTEDCEFPGNNEDAIVEWLYVREDTCTAKWHGADQSGLSFGSILQAFPSGLNDNDSKIQCTRGLGTHPDTIVSFNYDSQDATCSTGENTAVIEGSCQEGSVLGVHDGAFTIECV